MREVFVPDCQGPEKFIFRMPADCTEKTMTCFAERRKQKEKIWIFLTI